MQLPRGDSESKRGGDKCGLIVNVLAKEDYSDKRVHSSSVEAAAVKEEGAVK